MKLSQTCNKCSYHWRSYQSLKHLHTYSAVEWAIRRHCVQLVSSVVNTPTLSTAGVALHWPEKPVVITLRNVRSCTSSSNNGHTTDSTIHLFIYFIYSNMLPSVLWRCWWGGMKGIRPVKNWVVGCWHGYLSGASCRLAHGPADATATHCLLLQ